MLVEPLKELPARARFTEADLVAYVDDRLPSERRADVEAHLALHAEDAARVAAFLDDYVVDRSGSTSNTNGCGGNQNGDSASNTVLDCEIAAGRALNQEAIDAKFTIQPSVRLNASIAASML